MEFKIRRNTVFKDVRVIEGSTIIDLGLLSYEECLVLARQLEQAVDELLEGTIHDE